MSRRASWVLRSSRRWLPRGCHWPWTLPKAPHWYPHELLVPSISYGHRERPSHGFSSWCEPATIKTSSFPASPQQRHYQRTPDTSVSSPHLRDICPKHVAAILSQSEKTQNPMKEPSFKYMLSQGRIHSSFWCIRGKLGWASAVVTILEKQPWGFKPEGHI